VTDRTERGKALGFDEFEERMEHRDVGVGTISEGRKEDYVSVRNRNDKIGPVGV